MARNIDTRHTQVKLKDPIQLLKRSGVYRLECNDCKGVYISKKGRQLKIRIDKHKKAWEKKNIGVSAFADHLINSGHSFKEGFGVLHRENSLYYVRTHRNYPSFE